jgi:hypothetical protein
MLFFSRTFSLLLVHSFMTKAHCATLTRLTTSRRMDKNDEKGLVRKTTSCIRFSCSTVGFRSRMLKIVRCVDREAKEARIGEESQLIFVREDRCRHGNRMDIIIRKISRVGTLSKRVSFKIHERQSKVSMLLNYRQ